MYTLYVFLLISSIAACSKDDSPQRTTETAREIGSKMTQVVTTSVASNAVKVFDSELDKRKNLSAYTKTSSPLSAMVISPECIKIVNDPVYGAKRKVMQMNVRPQNTGGVTQNPRAQVQTPMSYVEGQDVYVGFSVRFTKTFWTYFLTFSEIYGAPYKGTAPFRLSIQESNIVASSYDGAKQINHWKQPMQANVWYDFVYRTVLSKDAAKGGVQVWLRQSGQKDYKVILPFKKMATITAANLTGPNYHKLACYYDKNNTFTNVSKKTRVSEIQLYFANHKVGGSFTNVAPVVIR